METTSMLTLSLTTALRHQMDVIAHNIANANTTAFKGARVLFRTYLQDIDGQEIAFVDDFAVLRNLAEGPITVTGNPLDLAIRGDAYFQVDTPDGVRFTRGGHLGLDADGALVTTDGYPVLAATYLAGRPATAPEKKTRRIAAAAGRARNPVAASHSITCLNTGHPLRPLVVPRGASSRLFA